MEPKILTKDSFITIMSSLAVFIGLFLSGVCLIGYCEGPTQNRLKNHESDYVSRGNEIYF
ncbi:MAG: hypothetical protein MHMPM18_002297 [Marteilia pararefringens]